MEWCLSSWLSTVSCVFSRGLELWIGNTATNQAISEKKGRNMSEKSDRKRGALLGLAVGDSLGAAVEFQGRGTFEPVKGYRDGGPHPAVKAGDWTDDTSMALALGDSIAEGWDPADQIKRYCEWMEIGRYTIPGYCFDIGNTTQRALFRFLQDRRNPFCGDTSADASGNGSIMRLAPVPIFFSNCYPNNIQDILDFAEQSSATTHASQSCVSACKYMALIMAAMIEGEDRATVLDSQWKPALELLINPDFCPAVAKVVKGSYKLGKPIRGSGYVVESLEAALWSFCWAEDFEDAVLTAVNLGDDADTTGAVCGQIAGAYFGESGIPQHLLEGLGGRTMIEEVLGKLVK